MEEDTYVRMRCVVLKHYPPHLTRRRAHKAIADHLRDCFGHGKQRERYSEAQHELRDVETRHQSNGNELKDNALSVALDFVVKLLVFATWVPNAQRRQR